MCAISRPKMLSILIVVALMTGTTYAGDIAVVDQQNPFGGDPNFYAYSTTLNQTFTPTLSAIDAVEVVLWKVEGYGEAPVRVSLYEGAGIYGNLLGTTSPFVV